MENIVSEPAVKLNWVSPMDYLAAERVADEKHEYFDGEVIVTQGASLKHEDIVSNLVRELGNKLNGKDCRIRASNLRTASPSFHSFTYPDATIVCGEAQLSDDNFDVLQNPVVIFEVVSKSSVSNDYARKWMYYRQVPSLNEYVLINSFEKIQVDIYRRNADNTWTFQSYSQPEELLQLHSVGISILMSDIYENINFEPLQEEVGLI
jgi:Uma2 family endonuclease